MGNTQRIWFYLSGIIILSIISIVLAGGILGIRDSANAQEAQDKPPATAPDEPVPPTTKAPVEKEEKGVYRLNTGEVIYMEEKKIELAGILANSNRELELLACTEGGKEYESMVVLKCKPSNIQLALMAFKLKEGKGPKFFGDPTRPTGDLVLVSFEWKEKEKTVSYYAEDLIVDLRTEKPTPRVGWSFTGSTFEDEVDFDTGKPTGRKIYLANSSRIVIATYHDPAAILDNPTTAGGVGNIFLPNKKLVPKAGTEVKVIIRVPDEKELAQLKKNIEEAEKWEEEWRKKQEEERKKEEKESPPEKK